MQLVREFRDSDRYRARIVHGGEKIGFVLRRTRHSDYRAYSGDGLEIASAPNLAVLLSELRAYQSHERNTTMPREILVHLNIEIPDDDRRDADAIADAILEALQHAAVVSNLTIVAPLAEEVG